MSVHRLIYDRQTETLSGANVRIKAATLMLQAGATLTHPMGHWGFSRGCKAVSAFVPNQDILIQLNHDALFAVPFADGYWSILLSHWFEYEGEIAALLSRAADTPCTFVDCGANFGYWSVLASSTPFGRQTVCSIEASPENFARLRTNAMLNGDRFKTHNVAIGRQAGGFAIMTGHKHEALGAVEADASTQGAVPVVSLNSLIENRLIDPTSPMMVKLDVEGVEIDAVRGGDQLLARDAVLICEDHGSDREHAVSRFLMGEAGLSVFVFDKAANRFERVIDLSVLDKIKQHRRVGYNVFATASRFWEDRLAGPVANTKK